MRTITTAAAAASAPATSDKLAAEAQPAIEPCFLSLH